MGEEFGTAAAGGVLIGLAAVVLMASLGRVAGISGISWAALTLQRPLPWRWLFLAGLVIGAAVAHHLAGVPLPTPSVLGTPFAVAGGFVVGLGVKLGNGCTSGHGVCGLGLRSLRSLAATLTFMATGIATVYVLRHILGVGISLGVGS